MKFVYAELVKINEKDYVRVTLKPWQQIFLFNVTGKPLIKRQHLRMEYAKLFKSLEIMEHE